MPTGSPLRLVVLADQVSLVVVAEVGHVLAHVPDVAALILGEVVAGLLDQQPVLIALVELGDGADPEDARAGIVEHGQHAPLSNALTVLDTLGAQHGAAARLQREVFVVDRLAFDETVWVELRPQRLGGGDATDQ